jgi:hypothetical protein
MNAFYKYGCVSGLSDVFFMLTVFLYPYLILKINLEYLLNLSMRKKIQRKTSPLLITLKKRLTINNCQPLIINF